MRKKQRVMMKFRLKSLTIGHGRVLELCVKFYIVLLSLCFSFCSLSVVATTELYSGTENVIDHSVNNKNKAMRSLMRDVLVKVAGERKLLSDASVSKALRQTQKYVKQFQYTRTSDGLQISVDFQPSLIDQLIRSSGFSVWSGRRPVTLFWVAEQPRLGSRAKYLLADGKFPMQVNLISEIAQQRGIPVLFPMMDLTDQQNISVNDVWGKFDSIVAKASERYLVEQLVSARLFPELINSNQVWRVQWRVIANGLATNGDFSHKEKSVAIAHMVDNIADVSAQAHNKSYLDLVDLQQDQQVSVDGIGSMTDYIAVLTLLRDTAFTRSLRLISFDKGVANFVISLGASPPDFTRELELDGRLLKQRDEFGIPLDHLAFRWRP